MSRPDNIKKMGYFPINENVVRLIASLITIEKKTEISVFDTCFGQGDFLAPFADELKKRGVKSHLFGVELNTENYKAGLAALKGERIKDRLVCGATEHLDTPNNNFNIIWNNPMFDGNGAEPERWFNLTAPYLKHAGLYLFLLPYTSLERRYNLVGRLSEYLTNIQIYRLPEEHRKYNEVLVVGTRWAEGNRNRYDWAFRAWKLPKEQDIPVLGTPDNPPFPEFDVTCKVPERFAVSVPYIDAILNQLPTNGISQSPEWKLLTRPQNMTADFEPLRELGEGHIAGMIAVGAFRAMPISDKDYGNCLLSGYGTKKFGERVRVDQPNGDVKFVEKEQPIIYLTVFNVEDGAVHEFSSQEPAAMQAFILDHLDDLKASIQTNFAPVFDPIAQIDAYMHFAGRFNGPQVLPNIARVRLVGREGRFLVTGLDYDKQKNIVGYWIDDKVQNGDGEMVDRYVTPMEVEQTYRKMMAPQVIEASAMAYALQSKTGAVMEIGQMGTGKTATSLLALYMADGNKINGLTDPVQWAMMAPDNRNVTFVIMAPGHAQKKWAREAEACFSNFRFGPDQTPAKIVMPGKKPRRVEHVVFPDEYEDTFDKKTRRRTGENDGRHVFCSHCGQKHELLKAKDIKNGITDVREAFAKISKRMSCKNCKAMMIDYIDTPLTDIAEAFDYQGLSVIVLSVSSAKNGASWVMSAEKTEYVETSFAGYLSAAKPKHRKALRCPVCGTFVPRIGVDGKDVEPEEGTEFDKRNKMKADEPNGRTKLFCQGWITRTAKDKGTGDVIMVEEILKEWDEPELDESGEPKTDVLGQPIMTHKKESVMVPKKEKVRCGAPLWQLTPLRSKYDGTPMATSQGFERPTYTGSRRYEMTSYIADQFGKRYSFVLDEAHQYKGADTTQGQSAQLLIANARRTIALTGTPYGGKASSVFYLLYRLFQSFRDAYGFKDLTAFVNRYGVKEIVTTINRDADDEFSEFGGLKKSGNKRTESEGNGVDPAIISRFLPNCTFLTLRDLKIKLPPRTEEFHWLDVDPELVDEAKRLHSQRGQATQDVALGKLSRMSEWMYAEMFWILDPTESVFYWEPADKQFIKKLRREGREADADAYEVMHREVWANAVPFTHDWPETNMTKGIADRVMQDWNEKGYKSVVGIAGKKYNGTRHIYNALLKRGLKPFVIGTNDDKELVEWCAPGDFARPELDEREETIKQAVEDGFNVLIVSPTLVATAIDLVDFNVAHIAGLPTYSVYIFNQFLSRLHRTGQLNPVTLNFWAYGENPHKAAGDNHLQALGIAMMSDKVRAAATITGDIAGSIAALNEEAGNIMDELKARLLSDEKPRYEGEAKDKSTVEVQTLPKSALEVEIEELVMDFEDHFVRGTPAPREYRLARFAPMKIEAREIELQPVDPILMPMPEPEPEPVGDQGLDELAALLADMAEVNEEVTAAVVDLAQDEPMPVQTDDEPTEIPVIKVPARPVGDILTLDNLLNLMAGGLPDGVSVGEDADEDFDDGVDLSLAELEPETAVVEAVADDVMRVTDADIEWRINDLLDTTDRKRRNLPDLDSMVDAVI